ncbi:MAG: hypothetical protein GY847_14255 [Proteobacteria bacterium]|nr:hypothetical protein [Pseudomonadota bacterium]
MATMESERLEIKRQPIWMLELHLDYCDLEYDAGDCSASGGYCYFTYPTCEVQSDASAYQANYSTRVYRFTNRGAPYQGLGDMPLLKAGWTPIPTKLNQDKFKTERGEMRFRLEEDDELPLVDPTKTATQSGSKRFWRTWLARNPNYHYRLAKLYRGYQGVSAANFDLYWQGLIVDIHHSKNGVEVRCIDMLFKAAKTKIPTKIESTNVLTADPGAGGVTIAVTDASDFETATANEPRAILIESEFIEYTGISAETLTGCTRGAWGSSAAAHDVGKKVKQALCYGANDNTGEGADHIFMDLLYRCGIDMDTYIATVDKSVTIDNGAGYTDAATTLNLEGILELPDTGVILIGSELIRYTGISGTTITGCKRGMYGTAAAAMIDDATVLITTATHELGKWHEGALYRGKFKSAKSGQYYITKLLEATLCDVWQNEAGKIEFAMQAPPAYGTSIHSLTDEHMIEGSITVDRNEDARITRVYVFHNPNEASPGDDDEKYDNLRGNIAPDEEEDYFYGEVKTREIFSPFIYRDEEATWLADHYFVRYREHVRIPKFALELYYDDIETADLVRLTLNEVVDKDGAKLTRLYRIRSKVQKGKSRLDFTAADVGFTDAQKFAVIGPESAVLDVAINDAETTIDLDMTGTTLTHSDWRTGDTHQIIIGSEKITYTTTADLTGSKTRLTGVVREVDGTSKAAHAENDEVIMLYSAATDVFRDQYGFIGSEDPDNLLDANGDFTETDDGYVLY